MLPPEEFEALSLEQRELLFALLKEKDLDISRLPITARKKGMRVPLSFAQQRLWFLAQLEPASAAYNMPAALRLVGLLNMDALKQSFNYIVSRHEVLRTTFSVEQGRPVQVIAPTLYIKLPVVDLRHLSQMEQDAEVQQLISAEAQQPFNLSTGPLLRVILLQLGSQEHILLFTMHHIIADGWSLRIFTREMAVLYESFCISKSLPLPELPVQYADFAYWQEIWVKDEALQKQLAYWKQQLNGAAPVLELPIDRSRPSKQSFRGSVRTLRLSEALSKRLKKLSIQEGASLFMTLLAAFKTLLYRYTGQEDIIVGSPIAGRNRCEIEGLIGFFVNTLVFRVNVSGNLTFRQLLGQVREVALGAYSNQEVGFERLVEQLQPERDLSRQPLFQVMFLLQDEPDKFSLPGLSISVMEVTNELAKFDLTLLVIGQSTDFLEVRMEYNTDLFNAKTIDLMLERFRTLLESIVTDPEQRLSDLKLFEYNKNQLLMPLEDITTYMQEKCLHEMFELQAEQTPDNIAISYKGEQITYKELNEQSNKIAHRLTVLGAVSQRKVAIMLENEPLQIITMLGVFKAGCTFVCLEPNSPTIRLKQVLVEVKPFCLLTKTTCLSEHYKVLQELQYETGYEMMTVDIMNGNGGCPESTNNPYGVTLFESYPTTNLGRTVSVSDPAYIVYTSGSTGKPKGILQSHQSFGQFLEWQSKQFRIQPLERIAQWASTTYDASYCEIFGALCFGATLCIAESSIRGNPAAIVDWLETEKINWIQVVPSFCKYLLQNVKLKKAKGGPNLFQHLKYMLLSGEVLPVELADQWLKQFGESPQLFNLYGPSETVLATYYKVDKVYLNQRSIPLGRAIDGRQILLLDKAKQLCPVGIIGEIWIRSPYLTLGYFQRLEETQKVFAQNPLHNEYPDMVYKTGDLGQWMLDGNIEFLGRIDNQVKIRGNRVELGEIEAILSSHGFIRECAVVIHNYQDMDQRLVAYIAPSENISVSSLRKFLAQTLPNYSIPSAFVFLDALPRTLSGKFDRKALPKPEFHNSEQVDSGGIPRTKTEKIIATLWQEALQLKNVSLHDNFFDLGGHSLLIVQVQQKIEEIFDVNLPVVEIFRYPTVSALAEFLEQEQKHMDSFQHKVSRAETRRESIKLQKALRLQKRREQRWN